MGASIVSTCGLCERQLAGESPARLCPGCSRATGERLDRMPGLYVALAVFLRPGGRRPELGRTGGVEAPLPVAEPVLNLRGPGGIVGFLEEWRATLHEDLGWSPPVLRGSIEDRINAAARGLHANLLWIATSWPAAGPFARDVRDKVTEIVGIVSPPERTIRLGNCPAVYEDGVVCGAVLRLTPGSAEVRCRWCGAAYPPGTWVDLARAQQAVNECSTKGSSGGRAA